MTKLLALAASTRADSLNKKLLSVADAQAEAAGARVTVLDYKEYETPFYHGEHTGPIPNSAAHFAAAVKAHDGILLASPEYNWSIPGGLKNLIDWLSVLEKQPFHGKTGLLLCASPSIRGGISGLQQLRVPLEVLGLWVYPQMIGIGDAVNQIGEQGLARAKDQQHLATTVTDFVRNTAAMRSIHA